MDRVLTSLQLLLVRNLVLVEILPVLLGGPEGLDLAACLKKSRRLARRVLNEGS